MGDEFWIQGDGGKFAGSKPGVPKKGGGQSKESVQPSKQPTQLDKAKAEFWDWAQRQTGTNISGDSPEKANAEGIAESVKTGKMDMTQAYAALAKNGGKVSAYQNAFNIVKNDMAFWSYYSGVGGSSLSDDMLARYAHGVVPGATDFVMNLCNVPDPSQRDVEAEKRQADCTIEDARKEDPGAVERMLKMASGLTINDLKNALKDPEFNKALDLMIRMNPLLRAFREEILGHLGRLLSSGTAENELLNGLLTILPAGKALSALKSVKGAGFLLEIFRNYKLGIDAKELAVRAARTSEKLNDLELTVQKEGRLTDEGKSLPGPRNIEDAKQALRTASERQVNDIAEGLDSSASFLSKQVKEGIKGYSKDTVDKIKDSYDILQKNLSKLDKTLKENGLKTLPGVQDKLKHAREHLRMVEAKLRKERIIE